MLKNKEIAVEVLKNLICKVERKHENLLKRLESANENENGYNEWYSSYVKYQDNTTIINQVIDLLND